MPDRVVKLRLSDEVYWAVLARAGSAKRLSQTVEELLKRALAAEGLESFKAPVLESSEHSSPLRTQSSSPPRTESLSPSSTQSLSPSRTQAPGSSSTETPRPAAERRELKVEVPPPRVELPGKPEPPPIPAVDRAVKGSEGGRVETPEERAPTPPEERKVAEPKGEAPKVAGPTPKQLALIESLLQRLGDDWGTVREVLLLDKGIEAPEDYRQLSGEVLDKVIKALKEWAKHPAPKELRDARLKAQKLFEQGIDVGLPESTRDVLRYHLVKLELAEAGALKPRK